MYLSVLIYWARTIGNTAESVDHLLFQEIMFGVVSHLYVSCIFRFHYVTYENYTSKIRLKINEDILYLISSGHTIQHLHKWG